MFASILVLNEFLMISISVISIGFSVDLIKTIQNPFDRFESRLTKIFKALGVINFFLVIYIVSISQNIQNIQTFTGLNFNGIFDVFFRPPTILVQVCEFTVAIYSLYVSFYGLCVRKGYNKQVQQSIFRRQVLFVLIRLITSVPFTYTSI